MQGINKKKHGHLTDALLQMEKLLREDGKLSGQTAAYRLELETMHGNYERLLEELARQITDYETLFSHVKVQFLGKKLKELRKEISVEKPAFMMLAENIRLVYGT